MRILTVGNSPFNNTANSRINAHLLKNLQKNGHVVAGSVWDHVVEYYMPEDGKLYFDSDGPVCELFILENGEQKVGCFYEHMKKFAPDIVLSIGDCSDISFIYAIKRMYPNLFKWTTVLTPHSLPINPRYKDALDYLDYAFITSVSGYYRFSEFCNVEAKYTPFRPVIKSPEIDFKNNFHIVASAKNSEQSNMGNLIAAVGKFVSWHLDSSAYIHTNVSDNGDYDLQLLKEKHDWRQDSIYLPDEFVSFYDGIRHSLLIDRMAEGDIFVDCSMTSATGLSMFEAASSGCLLVAPSRGAAGDLLSNLDSDMSYILKGVDFIAQQEGSYHIISQNDIYRQKLD